MFPLFLRRSEKAIARIFILRNRNYLRIADTRTNFLLLLFPLVLVSSFLMSLSLGDYFVRGNFAKQSHTLATFCITTFISHNFEPPRSLKSWQNGRQTKYGSIGYLSRDRKQSVLDLRRERILLGCI